MRLLRSERRPVRTEMDMVQVRQRVRAAALELEFKIVNQTKIVTAASELARNMMIYGGGGNLTIELVEEGGRKGVRLTFEDEGPGIADVQEALRDGFTSGSGMGIGLGGARRLVNEFKIESTVGVGTRIELVRWRD